MIYYYGLSADPITFAHIDIMKAIYKKLHKDDKLLIGVANTDEKNYSSTISDRMVMVTEALNKKLKYEDGKVMINSQCNRTYKFLHDFLSMPTNKNLTHKDITICVGEDEWLALTNGKWVNWDLLLKSYKFLVIGRENE